MHTCDIWFNKTFDHVVEQESLFYTTRLLTDRRGSSGAPGAVRPPT